MKLLEKMHSTDEFGVQNYSGKFLALLAVGTLYGVIALLAFFLLFFEQGASGSNISNYSDAFWTLQMSASTIGFGDHFPVTFWGRFVVALMFYIGVGLVGFIGALVANKIMGFADTNVRNRELRQQNDEILEHNKQLETKIDHLLQHTDKLLENFKLEKKS